jgi:hypothetical protein
MVLEAGGLFWRLEDRVKIRTPEFGCRSPTFLFVFRASVYATRGMDTVIRTSTTPGGVMLGIYP